MSRRSRLVAGAAAATSALIVLSASSGGQTVDPTVVLDRTGTAAGEQLLVTGAGWVPGSTLVVELCGQGGIHGSVDCDVAHQLIVGADAIGAFTSALTVGWPPSPCPCVVKVADETSHIAATAAIGVQGIPTVPITGAESGPVRAVAITRAELGGGSWTEWFAASSPRTLHLVIENTGDVAVHDVPLSVAWGGGDDPHGFVAAPAIDTLEPGESRELDLRLPRGAFAFGSYTATAEVQGFAEPVVARDSETIYPWGLLVLALVLVQVLLLRIRNRVRRRLGVEELEVVGAETQSLPAVAGAALEPVPAAADAARQPVSEHPVVETSPADERRWWPRPAIALPAVAASLNGRSDDDAIDLRDPEFTDTVVKAELLALQREVRESLRQSAEFSDGLVVAALARAEEARTRATEHERLARALAAEANEVVRRAHAEAMSVLAAAEATSVELRRWAEVQDEAARLALAAATRDQEAAVETARTVVERVLAELEPRIDELTARLEPAVVDLTGGDPPLVAPDAEGDEIPDDLDRLVADAILKALSSS